MRLSLLDLLACPECSHAPLEAHVLSGTPEVEAAVLTCANCERWFPVRDGIPSMLSDPLRAESDKAFLRDWAGRFPTELQHIGNEVAHGSSEDVDHTQADDAMLEEIKMRDRESAIYDSLYDDTKFSSELASYDALFQPDSDSLVADIGCGTGRVTKRYLQAGCRIIGIDFSFESLKWFREQLAPDQLERVELVHADACQVPLRSALFSHVLSVGMFYHLPGAHARDRALNEVVRLLAPQGEFVMTAYNFALLRRLRGWLGLAKTGRKEGTKEGGVYFYNHTPHELESWLKPLFRLTDMQGVDNRLPVVQHLSPRLSAFLDGWLSGTRTALRVTAREILVRGVKR